jgi:hypothetical protein
VPKQQPQRPNTIATDTTTHTHIYRHILSTHSCMYTAVLLQLFVPSRRFFRRRFFRFWIRQMLGSVCMWSIWGTVVYWLYTLPVTDQVADTHTHTHTRTHTHTHTHTRTHIDTFEHRHRHTTATTTATATATATAFVPLLLLLLLLLLTVLLLLRTTTTTVVTTTNTTNTTCY